MDSKSMDLLKSMDLKSMGWFYRTHPVKFHGFKKIHGF
jgi:hypothetical protein